ncbi:MAG: EamA family transporter [Candidatus Heimdallarchaeota archaeon]
MAQIIVLAIFLGILSYSMLNIGMGLQKKGAACLPKIEKQSFGQNMKNFFTNKTWLIGFLLVQIQWGFLAMALDFASVSIITPLMSVGMVALIIFSYFYLKEPITKVEMMGIIAIIIGIVVLGVTSPSDEVEYNLDFVFENMSKLSSIIFLIVSFIISILLLVVCISRKFANADILFSISAGITDALGAIFLRAYMGGADFRDGDVLREASLRWGWWVIFVLMIVLNATATIYLQVAYQRGKAVVVAPIFAVLAMITPVFGGILIFNEWSFYFTEKKFGFMAGRIIALVIIAAGAIILSLHSARSRKFDVCDIDEDEKRTQTPELVQPIDASNASE